MPCKKAIAFVLIVSQLSSFAANINSLLLSTVPNLCSYIVHKTQAHAADIAKRLILITDNSATLVML